MVFSGDFFLGIVGGVVFSLIVVLIAFRKTLMKEADLKVDNKTEGE